MWDFVLLLAATGGGAAVGAVTVGHILTEKLDRMERWAWKRVGDHALESQRLRRQNAVLRLKESALRVAEERLDLGDRRVALALEILWDPEVVTEGLSPWGVSEVRRFLVGDLEESGEWEQT